MEGGGSNTPFEGESGHTNSAASTKLANLSNMIGNPALHSWHLPG
jgi:hypothetical protein